MAEKLPGDYEAQDPLEQLLDEESDEEFGLPEFKEHLADSLTPAVLKDWTAADFASIYVRFRPHLERHAKRFLVNPSQVEEVVQDAFLYLMTTLPELDSELGVLKFLKWKTRLLALDVIRANSRASFAPIDEQPEIASNDEEVGIDLERADDAAIVALALAKLQPRHREALIATLYEEKANEVVAAQMGLNENAFRQLLFRARSAFKKALVGEAETAGLRASEILSIAARKAAKESGKYISAAGAFLLVIAISVGVLPNLSQPAQEQISAPQPTSTSAPAPGAESSQGNAAQTEVTQESEDVTLIVEPEAEPSAVESEDLATTVAATQPSSNPLASTAVLVNESNTDKEEENVERAILEQFFLEGVGSSLAALGSRSGLGYTSVLASSSRTEIYAEIVDLPGSRVYFDLNFATPQVIQDFVIQINTEDMKFAGIPRLFHSVTERSTSGTVIRFIATDFAFADLSGTYQGVYGTSENLRDAVVSMEVKLFDSGQDSEVTVKIAQR
jgi:RNA polymerase sigma factor (sigma-70 family)